MKIKHLTIMLLAVATLFVACDKNDPVGVTDLKLDKSEVSIEVGKTYQLVATVEPSGAAEVKWESTKPEIASVSSDGTVTGVSVGSAIIAATAGGKMASCMVTVTKEGTGGGNGGTNGSLHSTLQGSEYYIFQLDGVSYDKIQSKVVADLRPDDNEKFLYIWDDTYAAGSTTGLNFYGEAEGWVALTVNSVGWSGFGYFVGNLAELNKLSAIMSNPADYYFHIAIKSTDNKSHLFGLDGTAGNPKVCIGEAAFEDNGVVYQPYAGLTRDGEWNSIEIPMTYFTEKGLSYGSNNSKGLNVFWGLSGGTAGTSLQFDACFIYKK